MNYHVIKPDNFVKVKLPGLNDWTKALRSGEYEQGWNCLCSQDRYCCLGVLSKLQGRLKEDENHKGSFFDCELVIKRRYGGLQPTNPLYNQLDWNGKFPKDCKVVIACGDEKEREYGVIAACNDEGLNFNQIAGILEEFFVDEEDNKNTNEV